MMTSRSTIPKGSTIVLIAVACTVLAAPAYAAFPTTPVTKCAPDAVRAGSVCMDTYEASVWRVPNPTTTNKGLVKKIQQGKAKLADLTAGGATQLGVTGDDYAPCTDNGQTCKDDIYAVSLPGVTPSAYITWFQVNVACANAGKRLPSNAEWQMVVTGSPDPGPDNGTTDCNTTSTTFTLPEDPVNTGSRSSCVSAFGAYDMVGNLTEWVAEWVPFSTVSEGKACPDWGDFSDDRMCLSGASTTAQGPGALFRGGDFAVGAGAGPLAVGGFFRPSSAFNGFGFAIGFRCAR